MTNKTKTSVESDLAIHPGVTLAEAMGRPVQAVNEIVNSKKAITAETALQLERVLNVPARFWMNLQTDYDLTIARLAGAKRPERSKATR